MNPRAISNCPLRDTQRTDKERMGKPCDREAQIRGSEGSNHKPRKNLKPPEAAKGKEQVFLNAPASPGA